MFILESLRVLLLGTYYHRRISTGNFEGATTFYNFY